MLRSSTPQSTFRTPGTISLEISNPVVLLNEIAHRYESTERIVMEYVDNALDDAEALYQDNKGNYPYPIEINLQINTTIGEIRILDNCRGMSIEQLERVVRNVGESRKVGLAWVNGRFGFGVHAFRAAAQSISFQSKHALSSNHILELHRDQQYGIREARRIDEKFPTQSGTGTLVILSQFDREWFQGVSAETLRIEIERHFEQLLARPGITITVCEDSQPALRCSSFDYTAVPGLELRREMEISYHSETYPVKIYLKVAENSYPEHRVAFFLRGRRVAALAEVKSFLRKSSLTASLWDHPNLIGMIEVGELVQTKLFRDDFIRSRQRQLLYEAITALEPEIRLALQPIARHEQENNLTRIELTLQQALESTHSGRAPAIKLVTADSTNDAPVFLDKEAVCINMSHPNFQERLTLSQQGLPRLTDRLNAYLAGLLSIYDTRWRDVANEATWTVDQVLQAQVNYIFQMETTLRKQHREAEKALAASSHSPKH